MSKYRLLFTFIIILIIETTALPKAYAQTVYSTTMSGANSLMPNSSPATGTTTLTLLPDMKTVKISLNYTKLLGPETNSHLHGPAAFGDFNAILVIIPLGTPINNYVTTLTPEQVKWLQNGLIYADVHSTIYPDGEIRGWLKPEKGDTNDTQAEVANNTPTLPMPTSATTPTQWYHTVFSLSVCLPRVGTCDTNQKSKGAALPQQSQLPITVTVLNSSNKVIATKQGIITYNQAAGVFTSNLDMGSLANGQYVVKETVQGFPPVQQSGPLSITSGTTNILPSITETAVSDNWFHAALQPGGILHFLQIFLDKF